MIGKTISHYKILEKLGEGGMGEVYKALDTRLDRPVALKFLPPHLGTDRDARARFIQEAKSASSLEHTNICTVFDIDETDDGRLFIAMSCYEGESLKDKIERGPLPVEEAVDYAIQIAEGLSLAHEAGIIHRDIKPGNLVITSRGVVKIVDFGLAKMAETNLTKTGQTQGTAMYMSPEQARGEKVDQRTDIWSLGVVLYEILTGKQPFCADYEQAVIYMLMNTDPEPITKLRKEVPASLVSLVNRLMQKNKTDRFADMSTLSSDLREIQKQISREQQASEEKPEPSIAVLAFTNMSADPEQEYFCDGMAEEIINALTKVPGLRVAARTSAFYFKGKNVDINEIGQRLNVETVLEGSVRKAGNLLRITAQLVAVSDGFFLWSEKYDRVLEDVFAIQDEISVAIVKRLEITLGLAEKEALVKAPTDNLQAYDLYLKGRYFYLQWLGELPKAIDYFKQAIELDPDFALPYAGIAIAHTMLGVYGVVRPREVMPVAKKTAEHAFELDSTLAEVHIMLGLISHCYDWDWPKAEEHFKRAIVLDPYSAEAHTRYAMLLTYSFGRFDEAVRVARRAVELDPLNPLSHYYLGLVLTGARRYSDAINPFLRAIEIAPTSAANYHQLGLAYYCNRMYPEAVTTFRKSLDLAGRHPWPLTYLGFSELAIGMVEEATDKFDEILARSKTEYIQSTILSLIHAYQENMDAAFEALERAYEERDGLIYFYKYHPLCDPFHHDKRYDAFLEKIGFE